MNEVPVPPGLNQVLEQVQAPMQLLQQNMDDEDRLAREDAQAQTQFFKLGQHRT